MQWERFLLGSHEIFPVLFMFLSSCRHTNTKPVCKPTFGNIKSSPYPHSNPEALSFPGRPNLVLAQLKADPQEGEHAARRRPEGSDKAVNKEAGTGRQGRLA